MARLDFRAAAARRLSEDRELSPAIVSLLSSENAGRTTGIKVIAVDRIESNPGQPRMVFDEGKGLSTAQQEYDPTSIINEVRQRLEAWRTLPDPFDWKVTPETARLRQHWRSHKFSSIRTRHRRVAIKRHVRVGFLNHPDPKDLIRLRDHPKRNLLRLRKCRSPYEASDNNGHREVVNSESIS